MFREVLPFPGDNPVIFPVISQASERAGAAPGLVIVHEGDSFSGDVQFDSPEGIILAVDSVGDPEGVPVVGRGGVDVTSEVGGIQAEAAEVGFSCPGRWVVWRGFFRAGERGVRSEPGAGILPRFGPEGAGGGGGFEFVLPAGEFLLEVFPHGFGFGEALGGSGQALRDDPPILSDGEFIGEQGVGVLPTIPEGEKPCQGIGFVFGVCECFQGYGHC